jgi:DNA recombination protein RmuC
MTILLYCLISLAAGFILGWIIFNERFKSLSAQLASKETETSLATKRSGELKTELDEERKKIVILSADFASLQSKHDALDEKLKSQKEELAEMQKQMKETFENLATNILHNNSVRIQQQHTDKLVDILNPLKEKIEKFESRVDSTHKEALKDNASLKEQVSGLQKLNQTMMEEAKNLTTALKGQTKTQGNWGEMVLETLLEKSGLAKELHYRVQVSLQDGEGKRLQPDVVINLPDQKNLVIDAKVSLSAYERFVNSDDDAARSAALTEHIQSIRNHVKELSRKNYHSLYGINSLDFVLMFVPVEAAFISAVQTDPDLYADAFENNIVIITNSTLLATLRTIANFWRIENQNRNAQEIARQCADLYDKFVGFSHDLITMGKKMIEAKSLYDDAMNKLSEGKGNLVGRVEKIRKLGIAPSKSIDSRLLERAGFHEEE